MDKRKKTPTGTSVNQVRQQNAKSAGTNQAGQQAATNQAAKQGATNQAGQYKAEFASETDAQSVRQQNQKSQQKKGQNQK